MTVSMNLNIKTWIVFIIFYLRNIILKATHMWLKFKSYEMVDLSIIEFFLFYYGCYEFNGSIVHCRIVLIHEEPWLIFYILLMSSMVISAFMPMSTDLLYLHFFLALLAQNINESIHYLHRVVCSIGFGTHRKR